MAHSAKIGKMSLKNQLTKTPYLVMFIVLIAIGVGTASALITITLSGDVIITGFLDMTGDKIANVDTPTLSTDAATKAYVDSANGTDTLALLGCTNDQIALFFGGVWTCFTLTTYTDEDAIIAVGPHTSDTLEGLLCVAGEIAKSDGSGGWSCQPDNNTDSLAALNSCAVGEVPTWSGSAWVCGAETLGGLNCAEGEIAQVSGSSWSCQLLNP